MAAQLLKFTVEHSFFTPKDLVHRGLEIVVVASLQRPLKKRKGFRMSIKDHLLTLTRVSNNEKLPAVTEAEMGHLHCLENTIDQVTPIKLVGFSWSKP